MGRFFLVKCFHKPYSAYPKTSICALRTLGNGWLESCQTMTRLRLLQSRALGKLETSIWMCEGSGRARLCGLRILELGCTNASTRPRVEVSLSRSEEHTSELQSLRHLVC